MRAQLKSLHSPDVDLLTYSPDDPKCFSFFLQAFIGPEDEYGEDSFGFIVCTPRWFEMEKRGEVIFGAHYIIVTDYDMEAVEKHLRRFCERVSGSNWVEVAEKIGRVGEWEFENYQQ